MIDARTRLRLWMLFIVVGSLPHPTTSQGLFSRIFQAPCTERCGFMGLSVIMHKGTPGSDGCQESCVLTTFFRSNLECGSCEPNSFDIGFTFNGIPLSDQRFFTEAKARWETIITGDVSDRRLTSRRAITGCLYPRRVDDVYICARYSAIDGQGRILGSAGPIIVRDRGDDTGIPATGIMQFDSDDVSTLIARGGFDAVILHEIAHILGIGTTWESQGLAGSDADLCPYSGERATAEYKAISGCPQVPIETDGGPGTACSHWDERCLGDELMTGSLSSVDKALLSRISIATLEDIGYRVDYSTAEPFGIDDLGPGCACNTTPPLRRLSQAKPTSKRPRRRLSDESRQHAIEYGHSLLLQQSQAFLSDQPEEEDGDEGLIYVGDQVVTVFIEENDAIYDVVVTRNSNR